MSDTPDTEQLAILARGDVLVVRTLRPMSRDIGEQLQAAANKMRDDFGVGMLVLDGDSFEVVRIEAASEVVRIEAASDE